MLLALVYQAGIANIFEVSLTPTGREKRRRLYQGDFRSAEMFARGAAAAGASVRSYACNMAGDIINAEWSTDLDSAPFSDDFRPVNAR